MDFVSKSLPFVPILTNTCRGSFLNLMPPEPPSQVNLDKGDGANIIGPFWFCLRTQIKHEHIAAAHLKKIAEVEIFLPRIRFKRATQVKSTWITEALFPGYLFARFEWNRLWRQVKYAPGVSEIVHFGEYCPTISEEIIRELRTLVGSEVVHTIEPVLQPGDSVQIADGTFKGLQAVVSQILPARQRVAVLMEILGRQTTIEVTLTSLIKEGNKRASFLSGASRPQP